MLIGIRSQTIVGFINISRHRDINILQGKSGALNEERKPCDSRTIIRKLTILQNNETRILVRIRTNVNEPFKYNVEYIHAELSQEVKLLVI